MNNTEKDSMAGGLLVLGILFAILAIPMAIGHFTMVKDAAATTVHADASH